MQKIFKALTCAAFLLAGTASAASPGFLKAQALRDQAAEATLKGDHAAAAAALMQALQLRPAHPGIILALAAEEAYLGEDDAALTHLEQFAAMGLAANLGADDAFANLTHTPRFIGILATITRNLAPVGAPQTVATLGNGKALFEGLAIDPADGRIFAGSVRESRIVVVEQGTARDFVPPGSGLWSVYGLAVDSARGLLWAASASGPLTEGATPDTEGATGVFAFDLATGALKRKAVLPKDAGAQLGDLTIAADGTVYATDSAQGGLYRLAPGSETLEPFAADQRFVSLQGLTLIENGTILVVADYAMGLYAIDVATQKISPIAVPSGATVLGIDGLTGAGPLLMATQNGVNPQRVLRLALGDGALRLKQVAVMAANAPQHREITLGQIVGNDFYYIANSQWDRFGEEGAQASDEPFMDTVVVKVPVK